MAETSDPPTSVCERIIGEEAESSETKPKLVLVIALNGVTKVEANNPQLWNAFKEKATVIFTQDCHFIEIYLKDNQFTTNLSAIILADSALYTNIKYSGDRSSIMSTITSYLKTGGTIIMCSLFPANLDENKARFETFSKKLGLEWTFDYKIEYDRKLKKIQHRTCDVAHGECREHGIFRTTAQKSISSGDSCSYFSSHYLKGAPNDKLVFKFIREGYRDGIESFVISLIPYERGWVGYVGCYDLDNAELTAVILDMCGLDLKPVPCKACESKNMGDGKTCSKSHQILCCMHCKGTFCSDNCQLKKFVDYERQKSLSLIQQACGILQLS
ncbi:hypothetical protein DFH27DRAFT_539479 [Peziza echinospora]|nr:hypothetical protein DFH27DRAFT_539479 [Peziza echinospora]